MVSSYGGADKVPISKELVQRARRSNASYKEDMRKAEEEEKARLATREREKEEVARKKADEAITLRSGRRKYKILREKSRLRRGSLRSRTIFRRRLWQKAKR